MLRAWKIGSAFGIGVYVHWTFLLLPLLVLFTSPDEGFLSPWVMAAMVVPVAACIILHEFGHALTARLFGIGTRDITIYPIGGVARLERMSEKPWEEFWIAVAGPAVNVVIAAVLMIGMVGLFTIDPAAQHSLGGQLVILLFAINCGLVLFNMIPAFPMDGGRVLRALLASFLGQLRATRVAVAVAMVVGLLGAVVALSENGAIVSASVMPTPNPMLLVVVGFVFFAGQMELQMVERRYKAHQEEAPLTALPAPRPLAPRATSVFELRPAIAVYTWDNVSGTWVREPSSPPPRGHYGNYS